jgi:hypothetical protein
VKYFTSFAGPHNYPLVVLVQLPFSASPLVSFNDD